MNNYFFIGMPGCGKTYWAKQIADALNVRFYDTDEMIVAQKGKSIADIFEEEGELFFRKKEQEALQEIVVSNCSFVCSTGGGLPFFYDNFSSMQQHGKTIYLRATISFLINNINKDKTHRPLLKGQNLEEKLRQLFNERKAVYEQADFIFDAEQLNLSQLQNTILL